MLSHNHKLCIKNTINYAYKIAKIKNVRLTSQRLQVLQILLINHKALGAYDILKIMCKKKNKEKIKSHPPIVYRALNFLLNLNLIHKIESNSSYYACTINKKTNNQHLVQVFICNICNNVKEEIEKSSIEYLFKKANTFDFKIKNIIIECHGICLLCQYNLKVLKK